jgi:hypothetical protein
LKLEYAEVLSSFAFNFKLRRYNMTLMAIVRCVSLARAAKVGSDG